MSLQSDYTVGLGREDIYGQAVVPTRFFEADSTLKETPTVKQGTGKRPGHRVARGDRRVVVKRESSGDITLEAMTRGLGYLLRAFCGVSTLTALGESGMHQQVHTLKRSDFSESHTVQLGIPRLGSDVTDAFTYTGAQCGQLDIEAKADEVVTVKSSWVARELLRDRAYAAPSYPDEADFFTFAGGQVALGAGAFTAPTATELATAGAPLATVRELSASLNNGLDSNGFNAGGRGLRTRPAAYTGVKEDALGGSVTVEYTGREYVDAYLDQADLSLLLTFEGPDLNEDDDPDAVPVPAAVLQLALPLVRLSGDLPVGNGGDVITVQHGFGGFTPATGAEPLYVVYRSLDTAE